MSTSSRTRGIAALALLVVVTAGWLLWPSDPAVDPAGVSKAAVENAPPNSPPVPKVARTYKPGARTPVKRIVRNVSSPVASAAASAGTSAAPTAPAGPVDRRENPPPDAAATMEAIKARMDAVTEDIGECLGTWMELDPGLEGRVSMGFQLDADGLQEVWVADHTDVPFGPLTCFGSAIGAVDWTGVTSQPIEVTFPFEFNAGE